MAIQFSTAVRNARLDAIDTTISTAAVLKMFTGSPPSSTGVADSGTKISSMNLPTDWLSNAANGSKTLLGTWQDTSTVGSGTIGYFRIYASNGTTVGMQGTVSSNGGSGDLKLNNNVVDVGQTISITTFTLTEGNP